MRMCAWWKLQFAKTRMLRSISLVALCAYSIVYKNCLRERVSERASELFIINRSRTRCVLPLPGASSAYRELYSAASWMVAHNRSGGYTFWILRSLSTVGFKSAPLRLAVLGRNCLHQCQSQQFHPSNQNIYIRLQAIFHQQYWVRAMRRNVAK